MAEPGDEALLTLQFPDRPAAASAARKALASLNGSLHLVSEPRLRDAQLVISELVANAVSHGGSGEDPIHLTVRATEAVMRVEVRDHGGGFGDAQHPDPRSLDEAGGKGLLIVAALAHRWGVERTNVTMVWFEIDRPQREAPIRPDPTPPEHGGGAA